MSLLLSNTKEPDLSAQLFIYLTPHTQIRELVQRLNVNISNSTCLNKCLHMKKKTPPSHMFKWKTIKCSILQYNVFTDQSKAATANAFKKSKQICQQLYVNDMNMQSNLTTRGLCNCQNTEPGRQFVTLIQFNLIYIVPHHNSSHLKVLNSVR